MCTAYDGYAINMVREANRSAVKLVQLILSNLVGIIYCLDIDSEYTHNYLLSHVGFRDTSIYKGHLIHFYKRAQILVGDLWAAYGQKQMYDNSSSFPVSFIYNSMYHFRCDLDENDNNPFVFNDLHELTMFADYRIPQLLRYAICIHMYLAVYCYRISYIYMSYFCQELYYL
jgi:hypothetical protein